MIPIDIAARILFIRLSICILPINFVLNKNISLLKFIFTKLLLPQAFKLINFIVFPYGPNNNFLFLKCLVYFSFNELLVIMHPFFDNKFENKVSLAFK